MEDRILVETDRWLFWRRIVIQLSRSCPVALLRHPLLPRRSLLELLPYFGSFAWRDDDFENDGVLPCSLLRFTDERVNTPVKLFDGFAMLMISKINSPLPMAPLASSLVRRASAPLQFFSLSWRDPKRQLQFKRKG